ncbi:hypothetical protein QAD02_010139 [Eretmocerus hayati]|uniref:Uncharacterized protein n=1 Tax=Eretmocerus hayati TaxID=131215 RepID=A0ACC2NC28_9HYME|nr:hypothetical protein QAD02_010139 [Eretmocerus hayati]
MIERVARGIPDDSESCKTRSCELGSHQLREGCRNYPLKAQNNRIRSDEVIHHNKVFNGTQEILCPHNEGRNITNPSYTSDPIVDDAFEQKRMNGSSSRITRQTQSDIDPDDPRALLPLKCGMKPIRAVPAVVGGIQTYPSENPWMAALEYGFPGGSVIGCGGSLITAQHVLTAAHCLNPGLPLGWELQSVRLGEWNISSEIDCQDNSCRPRHIDVPVVMKIKHESYNTNPNTRLSDDIALLKLGRLVKFTDEIQPICLPIKPDLPEYMTVIGWGRTEYSIQSQVLLKAQIPLANKRECELIYRVHGFAVLSPTQICAGGERNKNSCSGDSGGPLIGLNEPILKGKLFEFRNAVLGIVSFGSQRCGTAGIPAVYTKVYDYVPWILDKIRSSSDVSV